MNVQVKHIECVLERIERLAGGLRADPRGRVRRSATGLLDAFETRQAIEPAVAQVLDSVRVLRRQNHDGSRREFQRRAHGLDDLERVIVQDLLPHLRRIGFDV